MDDLFSATPWTPEPLPERSPREVSCRRATTTESAEAGALGGEGSDPFKDTSGPSLNILIKLMSVVSLVIAPLIR